MILLIGFAFLAGVATVLSPCILPVLPVVLASALDSSRWRPLGVVVGLVISFAFFTLALTTLVAQFNLSTDLLRLGAAVVIALFGLVLLVPALRERFELLTSRFAGFGGGRVGKGGFASGAAVGASLGLVWAPCAGPILASVATVVATNRISVEAVAVIAAYSVGAGTLMLLIAYGGRRAISRVRVLQRSAPALQRAFAVLMLAFALTFFLGVDRTVEAALVQSVPAAYTSALTALENQESISGALQGLRGGSPVFSDGATDSRPVEDASVRGPASRLPILGIAPELQGITGWVNSEPTTLAALRGKVVIVDFWTYSCINCLRTLPYLNAWHEKYNDEGLVILGIHTPEFEFEKSHANVVKATLQNGIQYPVAQDNSYATWNAYNNRYWPAKYIVDAQGRVRYIHFGEGKYEETEQVIRALLAEAGAAPLEETSTTGYTVTAGRTPETYLGAARQRALASPEQFTVGQSLRFSLPDALPRGRFALQGDWTVEKEQALAGQGARLDLQFYADKVYLVLTPSAQGEKLEVTLDGQPIASAASGSDVRDALATVTEPRLYELVDLRGQAGEHRLSLVFRQGGTGAYAFTFG